MSDTHRMTDIILIGLNHKTAPVEIRECIAFSNEETCIMLDTFLQEPTVKESMVFSTCNRVEILIASDDIDKAAAAAQNYISDFKNMPAGKFTPHLYRHEGYEAVRHVFRVASSLDSMMVGEPQILGQIKEAYRSAIRKRTAGVILNRVLHKTFFVAKKIRSETGIGDHAVSISYAAIELGRKIFGNLEGKKVLLIGAGEMAELAVEHLIRHKVSDINVANRTFERGVELAAGFNGQAIHFKEIPEFLKHMDIIISSTGSPDFVLNRDMVKKAMRSRKNRPVFFIDIAVPRDIDPAINKLNNAYVYDIDDLKDVIDENIKDRQKEAARAERIIDEAVLSFKKWYESLDVVPVIIALRKKMEGIARSEIKKTAQSMNGLSEADHKALFRMSESMINKILHDPTLFLKGNGFHKEKSLYLDMAKKLFRLD
ncbi:glutamyl-tRNA reductase [Desulfobacterales bacterium HSG16]|nr:glutamyl-tRNA reductase [Desulfobacterales bacterium HSG16]